MKTQITQPQSIKSNIGINKNNNQHDQNTNCLVLTNESYKREFKDIDDIGRTLKSCFPHYSIKQILSILNMNSFDIQNSYNYLAHYPNINTDTVFTDSDDYIIRYMQSTDIYNELVNIKGETLINKRKKYLNI